MRTRSFNCSSHRTNGNLRLTSTSANLHPSLTRRFLALLTIASTRSLVLKENVQSLRAILPCMSTLQYLRAGL
jgi:hypothetical protein